MVCSSLDSSHIRGWPEWMEKFPQHLAKPNLLNWISNDNGETYNMCHFWFVASLPVPHGATFAPTLLVAQVKL